MRKNTETGSEKGLVPVLELVPDGNQNPGYVEYGDDSPPDTVVEEHVDPGPHYAVDSALAATPEEHRDAARKRGRPKGTVGIPKDIPLPPDKEPSNYVPTPKFNSFKSDATNPAQRTKALWNWWNALQPHQKDQLQAYVYRDWPILKLPTGVRQEDVGSNPSMDKISGAEPIQDDVDFLHRYGVGIYRLRLNKTNKSKNGETTSGTITTAYINGLGVDMKSHPPTDKRIADIDQIELTHPENGSYISFLRMQGKLPEQRNQKDEENEMAQVTAISEMTGLVKDLVNKNKDDSNLTEQAVKGIIDMTQKGAVATIEGFRDSMKDAEEIRRKAREEVQAATVAHPQAPAVDPFDQAIKIVTLMRDARGNDDILKQFMDLSQRQMERMETMMKESLNRPQAQPTPIVDRIKDLKDLREISRDLFGDKEEATGMGDAVGDAAGELAPKWLRPFIPIITPLAMGLAQAFLSPRPGAPVQYPPQYPPQPQPGANPYPPPPVQFPGPVSAPGPGPQPVPTAPQSQPVNPPTGPMPVPGMPAEVANLLFMIQGPFLNMIGDPQMSGTEFAGWFQDGFGVVAHNQVIAFGPEALFTAIASYPPIANELLAARMPEKRVRDFINEFCDPKWEDEEKDKVTIIPPPPAEPGPAAS